MTYQELFESTSDKLRTLYRSYLVTNEYDVDIDTCTYTILEDCFTYAKEYRETTRP